MYRLLLAALLVATGCLLAHRSTAVQAAGTLQVLAVPGGQPDDITVDPKGRLIWGNLSRGTIERLEGRTIVTISRGLSVPEGIIALSSGTLIVAEQGLDRIDRIGPKGIRSVLYTLQPVPGQEGVDGIGRDPRTGDLLVPDSPRGTVIRRSLNGTHARQIAQGLGRPVDAATDAHGNVLVPDENLGTLVVISPRGHVSHRGSFATPDDVAVDSAGRIWLTSLGDGGLWEISLSGSPHRVLSGLGNPQGLTLDRCGDPIVVEQNSARIVRLLLKTSSSRCAL